ncbi:MAG: hypothetical protein ACQERC_09990 [Bacteroidota bacterium]
MEAPTNSKELLASIRLLEEKRANDLSVLKEQYQITYDSFTPAHIIKTTLNDLVATSDLKKQLIKTSVSIGVGYLSKKMESLFK